MNTKTFVRPAAWVGCLNCYNNDKHVGRWVNAEDAADLTIEDLHDGHPAPMCEEFECFDTEGMPGHPTSVTEVANWGKLYEKAENDEQWGVFCAWVEEGIPTGRPSWEEFTQNSRGCFLDAEDFARFDAEYGLDGETIYTLERFIDWEGYGEYLLECYYTVEYDDKLYVFV